LSMWECQDNTECSQQDYFGTFRFRESGTDVHTEISISRRDTTKHRFRAYHKYRKGSKDISAL